jgi:hypothetical protein
MTSRHLFRVLVLSFALSAPSAQAISYTKGGGETLGHQDEQLRLCSNWKKADEDLFR